MINRILAIEKAVREGLVMKEESQIHSRISTLTPIKKPTATYRVSTIKKSSRLFTPAYGDDDESLLHQLRREEFERDHQGEDYFHDEQGQYNLSLDDKSSFTTLASPSFNRTQQSVFSPKTQQNSTFFSPTKPQPSFTSPRLPRTGQPMGPPSSRLSISRSMNESSEISYLGDLPYFCIPFT